jgi:hypothetical protein
LGVAAAEDEAAGAADEAAGAEDDAAGAEDAAGADAQPANIARTSKSDTVSINNFFILKKPPSNI